MDTESRKAGLVISLIVIVTAAAVTCSPFVFCSCSPRVYPTTARDSVRVETIRERVVHDTAWFSVPEVREVNVVRDTVSHLSNEWAESTAAVDTLGFLRHTLSTKPRAVAVPYTVVVHDTTVIDRKAETITVKVNELTKGQERWIITGKVAAGVLAVLALLFVVWLVLKIKKFIP